MKKSYLFTILLLGVTLPLLLCSCGGHKNNGELLNQAFKEAQASNWKAALELAEKAAKHDVRDISAQVMYGIALEHNGNNDEALQVYRQAAKTDSENFYAQYHLGRTLYQSGKFEDCLEPLRQAERLRPDDANTLVLLAQVESKMKLDTVLGYYKKLAGNKRFSGKPEPWNQIGLICAAKNDYVSAGKCFAQAIKFAPDNYITNYNMAIFSDYYSGTAAGRKAAIQYYRHYLVLTGTNPELQAQREQVSNRVKVLLKSKS